ncbi:uncharacterized protein J3D65DRAFT_670978 [Phyllosticta citribraziliensis]|uniref:BTB domain-containing protein n=1 Tax=Phyllosticta citribraziliensis TaxID=989973 RepID=A0ABR1LCN7_9PEZI
MAANSDRFSDWMWRDSPVNASIVVGSQERKTIFIIKRALLMQHSLFFLNAFNGGFREARTGVLHLPETDVQTFEIFTNWMRFDNLPTLIGPDPTRTRLEMVNMKDFINVYAFAHLYQVNKLEDRLKNDYMAAFFPKVQDSLEAFDLFPSDESISSILTELPEYSKLSRAVANAIVTLYNDEYDGALLFKFRQSRELRQKITTIGGRITSTRRRWRR